MFAALPPKRKKSRANSRQQAIQGTYRKTDNCIITVTLTNASDSKGGSFNGSAFFSLSFVSFTSLVAASKNKIKKKNTTILQILKVKNDHRSKFSNLTNWKEEA